MPANVITLPSSWAGAAPPNANLPEQGVKEPWCGPGDPECVGGETTGWFSGSADDPSNFEASPPAPAKPFFRPDNPVVFLGAMTLFLVLWMRGK